MKSRGTSRIGYGIAIIRINNKKLSEIPQDELNLRDEGFDIKFEIPIIEVINHKKQVRLQNLLLNYGFMIAPLDYLRNMNTLSTIRQLSLTVNSFFYRKGLVHNTHEFEDAILLETVTEEKLAEIMVSANKISESYNSKEIEQGEYLILADKPFEGLMAQVLSVSGNKVKVKLMIGADFIVELNKTYLTFQKVYNGSHKSHSKDFVSEIAT